MADLLAGITVLDLSSVGPAARAAGWLADYGADVVKVWAPAGSGAQMTPPTHAYSGGRGTRRIRLDLKNDHGREEFLRLAETADVVIESFRPGVVARLGIGYDDVKSRNPRIVYCSTSGYGQDGERSQWAGHDLNYLAVGGYLANAERDASGKPPLPGTTIADSAAGGMHALIAILAALVARSNTGEGTYLDVSVADGVLTLMGLQIDQHLATGDAGEPGSAPLGARYACYDVYRCAGGGWISVAAIEAKFWANFCRLVGIEECIAKQYDAEAQDDVRKRVVEAVAQKPRDEWVAILSAADTCVAPVLAPAEVAAGTETSTTGGVRQLPPLLAGQLRRSSYELPEDV